MKTVIRVSLLTLAAVASTVLVSAPAAARPHPFGGLPGSELSTGGLPQLDNHGGRRGGNDTGLGLERKTTA
jgi:hypothetical protein